MNFTALHSPNFQQGGGLEHVELAPRLNITLSDSKIEHSLLQVSTVFSCISECQRKNDSCTDMQK